MKMCYTKKREGEIIKIYMDNCCLFLSLEENTREAVAENIYQYIPNVFKNCSAQHGKTNFPFILEKLYNENRTAFMSLYEEEKQKLCSPSSGMEE